MKVLRLALVALLALAGCAGSVLGPSVSPTTPPSAPPTSAPSPTPSVARPTSPLPTSRPTLSPTTAPPPSTPTGPTLVQLVGQKLVVRMDGTTPSADLLGRVRRGEIGGVILFGANITTRAALIALTGKLRAAAAAGGKPALLIAVDQEGGAIKRIPWAPPTMTVPAMGSDGRASVAQAQGADTGAALRALGINLDLAPVADVPGSSSAFMYQDGRTFSFDASVTATLADAFATGLVSGGVVPSMKHFPGIGLATANTDSSVVAITASAAALDPGLLPYRTAIGHDIPLIMLSNATYPAWDPANAAGWSASIAETLLRSDMGFTGVTITDSLDGAAAARHLHERDLAVRAAMAGTDLILATGSEATTKRTYATLLAGAQDGSILTATLRASYDRIMALKAGL